VVDKTPSIKVVGEQAVPDWDNDKAVTIFEQMYTAADGKIDGVYAANDGLAGSVISILEKNKRAGQVPVTGQDATVEGLQNVLAGTQCVTVYKSAKEEADALAKAAIALVKGETVSTDAPRATTRATGCAIGSPDPKAITKDNVDIVFKDGGQSRTRCAPASSRRSAPQRGSERPMPER